MSQTAKTSVPPRLRYSFKAYQFLFDALRKTQTRLGRSGGHGPEDEQAHVSGQELMNGVREYALDQFGLMAICVFRQWGIRKTDDFGDMVFEMIERGEMRKTDADQRSDFCGVYDFQQGLVDNYLFDVSKVFDKE